MPVKYKTINHHHDLPGPWHNLKTHNFLKYNYEPRPVPGHHDKRLLSCGYPGVPLAHFTLALHFKSEWYKCWVFLSDNYPGPMGPPSSRIGKCFWKDITKRSEHRYQIHTLFRIFHAKSITHIHPSEPLTVHGITSGRTGLLIENTVSGDPCFSARCFPCISAMDNQWCYFQLKI